MFFKIKEYYTNEEPKREIISYVRAKDAIAAIRTKTFWRNSTEFTSISKIENQAHTQDGNGKNGCQAVKVSAKDYKCRLRETADGGFQFGFTARPDQMAGTMEPFRPHWWCQYMGNGAFYIADDYKDMLGWMRGY